MINIYGTLGPKCSDIETLTAMFDAGMTGVRLNLSHVTLKQAANQISILHSAAEKCGKKVQLLIDMQGPELRIGSLEKGITLVEASTTLLGNGGIPIPAAILPFLCPGQQIFLDDGKILLTVKCVDDDSALCVINRGGFLSGKKSIALPGISINAPTMTEEDIENIACASQYGVTAVMQPFVRNRDDLIAVRSELNKADGKNIKLFAKIENMDGVDSLDELIPVCEEIVIARGDLGNAMPLWKLPGVQKQISKKCRSYGKPFMVVTQMLTSMEKSSIPTRAEVSDVFNAVIDGAHSLMVTGETAVGNYPVEVIRYLANTAKEAEKYLPQFTEIFSRDS